jgi:ABC-type transport system involved in multi-copper enzyme maturation permease subunit
MIRLSWRQFRNQAGVTGVLLIAVAILFAITGPHLAHIYGIYARAQAACLTSTTCESVRINVSRFDLILELIGTALVAVPALIGAFWGAPLISRELEHGTQRLVWTQSITRTRWLATKLALVGLASVVATGLLSLMVTWWSRPIDEFNQNRFGSGVFGERDIAPLGYAAFGFVLGVTAGLLIRRALPAMAATLAVFLGVRLAFTYLVRPNLISPAHRSTALDAQAMGFGSTNGGPVTLLPNAPNLPNAWIYSTHLVDGSGHPLTPQVVAAQCPTLSLPANGPAPGQGTLRVQGPIGVQNALSSCVTKLSSTYHQVTTYQPASRYWIFQGLEVAIYLAAALALVGLCFYWIRRRLT